MSRNAVARIIGTKTYEHWTGEGFTYAWADGIDLPTQAAYELDEAGVLEYIECYGDDTTGTVYTYWAVK